MQNIIVRRGADGVVLELHLDEEQALRVADTIRELLGASKPPVQPAPWQPLASRPAAAAQTSPTCPTGIRAEIQAHLDKPTKWPAKRDGRAAAANDR